MSHLRQKAPPTAVHGKTSSDLGYQASQRIVSAAPEEALSVLTRYSQNLPALARSLSRTRVTPELRAEVATVSCSYSQTFRTTSENSYLNWKVLKSEYVCNRAKLHSPKESGGVEELQYIPR